MLWIDQKYANLLSAYVRNFKRKSDTLFQFSCVFCGDSKTNPLKARGYLFKSKTGLIYHCHKCNVSANIGQLLQIISDPLYEEYKLEQFKESGFTRTRTVPVEPPIPEMFYNSPNIPTLNTPLADSIKIADLDPDHIAVQYLISRKIPEEKFNLFWYSDNFKQFCNTLVPGTFSEIYNDHPRLIIPYFSREGKCFCFQGRAFGNETPKYHTIKLNDDEKIYGLNRIDFDKPILVVEGPIDSLFLSNAIAVSGSSFNLPALQSLKSNLTVVFDNDTRNKQIVKLMKNIAMNDFNICVWPNTFTPKDINEAILQGYSSDELETIIKTNTCSGPEALLKLAFLH